MGRALSESTFFWKLRMKTYSEPSDAAQGSVTVQWQNLGVYMNARQHFFFSCSTLLSKVLIQDSHGSCWTTFLSLVSAHFLLFFPLLLHSQAVGNMLLCYIVLAALEHDILITAPSLSIAVPFIKVTLLQNLNATIFYLLLKPQNASTHTVPSCWTTLLQCPATYNLYAYYLLFCLGCD